MTHHMIGCVPINDQAETLEGTLQAPRGLPGGAGYRIPVPGLHLLPGTLPGSARG